jgi:hypothetical protein
MRIYNGTKSMLDLPLTGIQRLSIPPLAVSGDFMPTNEFLSLLVTTFDYNELAIIVSGPYEISMCANVSGAVGFVVSSLEEAIDRFTEKEVKPVVEVIEKEPVKEEKEIEACKEEESKPEVVEEKVEAEENEAEANDEITEEEVEELVKKPSKKVKVKKASK